MSWRTDSSELAHVREPHAIPIPMDQLPAMRWRCETAQQLHFHRPRPIPRLTLHEYHVRGADADDVPGPQRGGRPGAGVAQALEEPDRAMLGAGAFGLRVPQAHSFLLPSW